MEYIGTSHFVSRKRAVRYYRIYDTDSKAVDQMIAQGDIHIGPPKLEPGDRLKVIPDEGRYQIERRDK